eukprot:TRINITY_DN37228_c0_g1_i1.p1 TRINITY_DN37228_c0_g1~~TRINITY_DN37228_c0_g1_i1.p1  ORF type:complete len:763 (-),score=78.68 TRINITY_DN37228_c0_g1_i1:12-2246(-)
MKKFTPSWRHIYYGGIRRRCTGDSSDSQLPWRDGEELHRRIPAERWCVTRQDLFDLRRRVQQGLARKEIVPTDLDPFQDEDVERVGPSVYTVVAQLVKPVTDAAGRMSWALMCHEEGLPCDLFVTHAWVEGIFEFIDKVTSSWPFRHRGAYICFLSNPQNLDINHLICKPEDSPFAKCLHVARTMLVAPNRKVSIYTRMWCVYEAFVAYNLNMTIVTASRPARSYIIGSLTCFSCVMAALVTVSYAFLPKVLFKVARQSRWNVPEIAQMPDYELCDTFGGAFAVLLVSWLLSFLVLWVLVFLKVRTGKIWKRIYFVLYFLLLILDGISFGISLQIELNSNCFHYSTVEERCRTCGTDDACFLNNMRSHRERYRDRDRDDEDEKDEFEREYDDDDTLLYLCSSWQNQSYRPYPPHEDSLFWQLDGAGLPLCTTDLSSNCSYIVMPWKRFRGETMMKGEFVIIGTVFFMCLTLAVEVDRIQFALEQEESNELLLRYDTVLNAECSKASDKASIFAAMERSGCSCNDIDENIEVLLQAGVSDKTLRKAHRHGVRVKGAGNNQRGTVVAGILGWFFLFLITNGMMSWIILGLLIAWILVFSYKTPGGRSFAVSVLMRIFIFPSIAVGVISYVCFYIDISAKEGTPLIRSEKMIYGSLAIAGPLMVGFGSIVVILSAAGIGMVSSIPWLGPYVAGILTGGLVCNGKAHGRRSSRQEPPPEVYGQNAATSGEGHADEDCESPVNLTVLGL